MLASTQKRETAKDESQSTPGKAWSILSSSERFFHTPSTTFQRTNLMALQPSSCRQNSHSRHRFITLLQILSATSH